MLQLTYAMPCYNHGRFLVEALNSIKADILSHDLSYEVLVIDDGSLDESVAVINGWVADNPQINLSLIEQENHGIAKTVNKLYRKAKGEFVRLCASDDTIFAGSSKLMMNFASRSENTQCVFGDGLVVDNESNQVSESFISYHGGNPVHLRNNQHIDRKLISRWCIAGPCILVRRSFFENYQYDEASRIDDFDFFLNLFKMPDSVLYMDEKVCAYRVHGNNTSKVRDVTTRVNNLSSFCYLLEKYCDDSELFHLRMSLKAKLFLTRCKIAYLQKRYVQAVASYVKYTTFSARASLSGL